MGGFEEDYGIDDMTDSSPEEETSSGSDEGNSNKSYSSNRYAIAFYKPKKDFDINDPKKRGAAFQCELSQYDTYNSVFISMARQMNPQTQQAGSRVFDWNNKDNIIKFKCGIVDIQQILTVLTYMEPEVGLFHKSQAGRSTTFQASIMGKIEHDSIKNLCQLWEKGDSSNKPRTKGINPKSISISLKSGDSEFKIMLTPHEVVGLRIYMEEALIRMYSKPYVKKS